VISPRRVLHRSSIGHSLSLNGLHMLRATILAQWPQLNVSCTIRSSQPFPNGPAFDPCSESNAITQARAGLQGRIFLSVPTRSGLRLHLKMSEFTRASVTLAIQTVSSGSPSDANLSVLMTTPARLARSGKTPRQ